MILNLKLITSLFNKREGNCTFIFDLRKVYWSNRLQPERDRMLKSLKKDAVLCDAFCGCGPMALRAAKQGVRVLANDLNPDAFDYLRINVAKNKVGNKVNCFNMDARAFIRNCLRMSTLDQEEANEINFDGKLVKEQITDIYMNLPKDAFEFLDVFYGVFKNTLYGSDWSFPVIHVYGFSQPEKAQEELTERAETAMGGKIGKIVNFERVREISTRKFVYCLSFIVSEEVANAEIKK